MVAYPIHIEEDTDYIFDVNGTRVYVAGPVSFMNAMRKIASLTVGAKVKYLGKGEWDNDEELTGNTSRF